MSETSHLISTEPLLDAQQTYALDRAHVFHSWSAQATLDPMTITQASGSYVWDSDGHRLLDFSSQLVFTNLGHQHSAVVRAIQEQAARMCTIAPQHANDARSAAAHAVAEVTPGDLDRVFFTTGGAEAVEHAVRMARLHTGRPKVLSRYRSYHGGTQTAINLTGDPRRFRNDSGTAGVAHFFGPFLYRSPFYSSNEAQEADRSLAHLEQVIELEGPATIAAIILEPVPGTAGVMVPPPGYLRGVRELCDRHGIVLIADEVMVGFGRTGRWFAIEHGDVVPDLLTFAKGVTSGYVPLGGVAISPAVADSFAQTPYPGGSTYSGHPLASAAAVATIATMHEEGTVDAASRLGSEVLGPGLRDLEARHPCLGEVRGVGAFWALELVRDPVSREPLAPYGGSSPEMNAVVGECKKLGLLPFVNFNRIHVAPPLNLSDDEAAEGLAILDQALAVGDAAVN